MSDDDTFQDLKQERAKILEEAHSEVLRLHAEANEKLQKIARRAAKVARESEKIPCLVRWTPGPDLTIYHSADCPCGRVRERHNFRRMTEKTAKNASQYAWLERCSACSWPAAAMIHGKRMLKWE
ncbi:hypothetical protein ACFVWZ_12985 [Streptomyces sp. NPDC058200]|uniref:hypothetical protein n=1 Tax=Streptomyces sp. NPDC058200 TaxID=3346378 RepID=UPI0036E2665F